jgi:hypothetical protein
MATNGTPDWQNSFGTENFTLLPAYRDASMFFVVPRVVWLAERDGSPDFFLEFVSDHNGAGKEESLYATIELGLTRARDTADAYRFLLVERKSDATLMPATFTTETFWHLECEDVHETGPFAWEDMERATIHRRIPTKTALLLYSALEQGRALPMARAAVECEMAAFLPRIESTVTFNRASLHEALGSLNPGGPGVPFRQMVTFFEQPHPGLLKFEGGDRGVLGRSLGLAMAGRVRHFFGKSAPCPRLSDGPHIALIPPSAGAMQEMIEWDLRTPLVTGCPVFLDFDPFTPIKQGARDSIVKYTKVPPLPLDLLTERVQVACDLPPNIRNCEEITLTLFVGKDFSFSGQNTPESVTLYPGGARTTAVELKFKTRNAKSYRANVTTIGSESVLEMPWFDCKGDYLYIGANRLAEMCVTVRAATELLAQAGISATITAGKGAEDLAATLTSNEPAATFLLSRDYDEARLIVTARDPAHAGNTLTLNLPCRSVSLDLFAFHEYGRQTAEVTVRFPSSIETAQFEFLPECGTDKPIVLTFSPELPSEQFSYYSTKLFENRYRFRPLPVEGQPDTEWSDYRIPGQPLVIHLTEMHL